MSDMTEIILRLLWRFYPIAWLSAVIVRGLSAIASWLEEEGYCLLLAQDREECAWVGGWLALAEDRLNELIVMKAMRRLGRRAWLPARPQGQIAGPYLVRAVRRPEEILKRLTRLCHLYHDHQRLYELRAQKLARLFAEAELQLEAIHHPVEPQPRMLAIERSTRILTTLLHIGSMALRFAACAPHPGLPIRVPP